MRILVVGAGAVGGFVAARLLAPADSVTVLVRPARAVTLREHGLRVVEAGAETVVWPAVITAAEVTDEFDLVILAVKGEGLSAALDDVAPAVSGSAAVVPFLNGMGHLDMLVARFGSAVLGGVLRCVTELDADGSIHVLRPLFEGEVGELDGAPTDRVRAIAELFTLAGASVAVATDIVATMWAKWVYIATVGTVTSLARAPIGEVVATPDGSAFARLVVRETTAVAAAEGYPIGTDAREALEATVTAAGSPLTSSLSRDLMAGRPTEVEPVLGDLLVRARARSLPTPLLTAAVTALRVHNARLGAGR